MSVVQPNFPPSAPPPFGTTPTVDTISAPPTNATPPTVVTKSVTGQLNAIASDNYPPSPPPPPPKTSRQLSPPPPQPKALGPLSPPPPSRQLSPPPPPPKALGPLSPPPPSRQLSPPPPPPKALGPLLPPPPPKALGPLSPQPDAMVPAPNALVPAPNALVPFPWVGLIAGILIGVLVLIGVCIFVIFYRRKKRARSNNVDEEWEKSLRLVTNLPTRFSYEDLASATENFNRKLGGGGFGSVYLGALSDGTQIAVKRLDRLGQGKKEFLAEVKTIGSIHHINLVRLMGFCAENSHRLLVYEYMRNGSLDKWIFNRNQENALKWEIRKNIILDVAKGLAYLHEECRMRIAHLDIKPQNILLDDNFNAKLSDFGLATLIDKNQSQVITQVRGTRGYMAPEWLSRKITEKVDVYSFGVVILEIVCGRKNMDFSQPEEDDHLLLPIVKHKTEENRLYDLVDKCIEDMQQHLEEAEKMLRIGIWCLQSDSTRRPSMSVVVKVLEGVMVMEPMSNYSFLTSTMVEAPTGAVFIPSNPQPASVLSGPR